MDAKTANYLDTLLNPMKACAVYKPKFGTDEGKGISLDRFKALYGEDPFYHWVGLDSELMDAAHKAAGGMTSVYRQLGVGWERLFRTIIKDRFGLTEENVSWSFEVIKEDGKKAKLTLDGRLDLGDLKKSDTKPLRTWLDNCGKFLAMPNDRVEQLRGAVFEVRQGYKSADAKRQNADLRFGMNAATENYLPVVVIGSTQASTSVLRRYRNAKMLVLTGVLSRDDTVSHLRILSKCCWV